MLRTASFEAVLACARFRRLVCEGARGQGARALRTAVRAVRGGGQAQAPARAPRRCPAALHSLHGHATENTHSITVILWGRDSIVSYVIETGDILLYWDTWIYYITSTPTLQYEYRYSIQIRVTFSMSSARGARLGHCLLRPRSNPYLPTAECSPRTVLRRLLPAGPRVRARGPQHKRFQHREAR